jgi:hypothetical protein
MPNARLFATIAMGLLLGSLPGAAQTRFNRDVRPILSDHCFTCHGPDAKNKNIPLRLDSFEAATADLGNGRRAITPGDPEKSQLVARIQSPSKALRMPQVHGGNASIYLQDLRWS